jgi:Bacterial PH domain
VPRVISSAQTFFVKFILPFVVVGMMTFGAAVGGRAIWPFFFPLIVMLAVSFYWYYVRLKKVIVEEDGLVVSNFVREIRVPWRDIVEVSGSRWVSTRQITITLDRDLGFGTSIIFMPKTRMLWPGQEHPAAQELRNLIRENISHI